MLVAACYRQEGIAWSSAALWRRLLRLLSLKGQACKSAAVVALMQAVLCQLCLASNQSPPLLQHMQAMRLFVGEPVWTPFNRPQEQSPSRRKYLDRFAAQRSAVAA